MPLYEENTSSMAASATLDDALSAKRYRQSKNSRTLRGVAAYVRENTPAADDITAEVYIGEVLVAKWNPGLARTTGADIQAEDYKPINLPVAPNEPITVKMVNNDAAAAHTARLGVLVDGF